LKSCNHEKIIPVTDKVTGGIDKICVRCGKVVNQKIESETDRFDSIPRRTKGGLGGSQSLGSVQGTGEKKVKDVRGKVVKKVGSEINRKSTEKGDRYQERESRYLDILDEILLDHKRNTSIDENASKTEFERSVGKSTKSVIADEAQSILEKCKKNNKIRNKDTKKKVCAAFFLVARKNGYTITLKDTTEAILKVRKNLNEIKSEKKSNRIKNEITPYWRLVNLMKKQFPELIVHEKPDKINAIISKIPIPDYVLQAKFRNKVASKVKKVRAETRFASKSQSGIIAAAIVHTMRDFGKNENFPIMKQIEICKLCDNLNPKTLRTNLKDFEDIF
tara:strand:+ start:2141 stop:3139 length:999 start_codon:yes stop_codon:yes gene_type:complete